MTKADLVEAIAEAADISKAKAGKAVEAVISGITGALKKGDKVQLVGFGSFLVRSRKARTGRNPRTGESLKIAARKIPVFKPGKALRDAVK